MDCLASIIIVTYNHRHFIGPCITSILDQDFPNEIIVIDNCSSDGHSRYIEEHLQNIRLIRNQENIGYGAGNNLGARNAVGNFLVFLNPDTIVEKNWLKNLIDPLVSGKKIITTPKILLYDGSAINTCGNINHFTGLTFTRGLFESPLAFNKVMVVSGISGACFAIKKADFFELGEFDEHFFIYNEDSELSWRAHHFHFSIYFIPSSVIRHYYSLTVTPQKLYFLEKGRYLILRKFFYPPLFIIFLPSLLITELITIGYASKYGIKGLQSKIEAIIEGFRQNKSMNHFQGIDTIKNLEHFIPLNQLISNKYEKVSLHMCNWLFLLNYQIFMKIFS